MYYHTSLRLCAPCGSSSNIKRQQHARPDVVYLKASLPSKRIIWHSISLKGEKDNIIELVCMDAWTPVRWVTLLHAVHCTKLSN